MTASLFDSPTWRGLFHDAELSPLFSDTAELRAMLLVMGSLAVAQAKEGLIPEVSAKAIQRAALEVQVDPGALASVTAQTGDHVIALIGQFQNEMQAPEHAKWVHHDSDTALTAATGLSLRLRQSLKIIGGRMGAKGTPPKITWLRAYHTDFAIRKGLAAGLDLTDAGDTAPVATIAELADWITHQAAERYDDTPQRRAIAHQIPVWNAAIQTAPTDTAPLVQAMTLPQMVLGLGRILA